LLVSSVAVDAECVERVGDALWACGSTTGPLSRVHFASSLDGAAWTEELRDDEIVERRCPSGTIGASACAAYAPPVDDAGPGALDDAGDAPDGGGLPDPVDEDSRDEDTRDEDPSAPSSHAAASSCAAASGAGPALVVLAAALSRRRRTR
jgi:hypothetical protein